MKTYHHVEPVNGSPCRRKSVSLSLIALASVLLAFSANSAEAASADTNIWWNEVFHDTSDPFYRSPQSLVAPETTVRLRLRVAQSDITSARVRVWWEPSHTETYYPMAWDGDADQDPETYDYWFADIPTPSGTNVGWYFFEINDDSDQDFYTDDDNPGGAGMMRDLYDDGHSFGFTVSPSPPEAPRLTISAFAGDSVTLTSTTTTQQPGITWRLEGSDLLTPSTTWTPWTNCVSAGLLSNTIQVTGQTNAAQFYLLRWMN